MHEVLGGKRQRAQQVAQDAPGSTIDPPDAIEKQRDQSGLKIGVLDVFRVSEKDDAQRN